MSRFLDAILHAEQARRRPRAAAAPHPGADLGPGERPFQVLTVTSNKGGVGKTTIAANLAVSLRAQHQDRPVLVMGLDDQDTLDRMFGPDDPASGAGDVGQALRSRRLAEAIRPGRYGVHYVPSSPDVSALKRELTNPLALRTALAHSGWRGLVVLDTKSDLEILTRNALAAADLVLVVVKDRASLDEAAKVFALLEGMGCSRQRARVVLSLVDRRVKFTEGETGDVLALLLGRIRERGYPLLTSFLSSSPKVESLLTNPEDRALPILHGAPASLVNRQMLQLAEEVAKTLDELRARLGTPREPETTPRRAMADWRRLLQRGAPP